MATTLAQIEATVRLKLVEPKPKFWSSPELQGIIIDGIKDLWRDTADLKQEHYLKFADPGTVTLAASTNRLAGLPDDIHKIYSIEALYVGSGEANQGLVFQAKDRNHKDFQLARSSANIEPTNATIYYAITGPGGPVGPPIIYVAPKVTSAVVLEFGYVPTFNSLELTPDSIVPVPGEADNAIVAWTVAYARAKEREDRTPDPGWLSIYGTEKQHILQSLGLRQYQDLEFADAIFQEWW